MKKHVGYLMYGKATYMWHTIRAKWVKDIQCTFISSSNAHYLEIF